ncbi:MAG: MFS transporter [Nocardioidaceae bacterium]|nr:MFS transporter [Nocardioidaceae bacterium]
MTWQASFAPLRSRNFAWYYASRFVNTLGSMMANVALTFAVLDITDSASALGAVLAAHTIPMVLLLLYGGVISDRLPRTLVLQVSNVASALTQGTIALLVLTDAAQLWMLVALSVVHGVVSAISFPAMASVLPQLVPREQLQPANALLSLSRNGLTVLGPTLGALIVVSIGSGWALAIDAATWALAALFLLPVRIPPRPQSEQAADTLRELREGWDFFRSTTWLWVIVVAFGFLNAISTGAWFTLGPVVAQETIGRQAWGFVLSAEGVGLLVMSLLLLWLPLRRPLLWGMLAISLVSAQLLVLGLRPEVVTLVVVSFVAGAGVEVFALGWNLAMQEHIDEAMLSRAYSYDALGSFVAMPVGQLSFGALGERFGFSSVLVVSGIAYAAIALLTLASRSVRHLPRRIADAGTPAVH